MSFAKYGNLKYFDTQLLLKHIVTMGKWILWNGYFIIICISVGVL
jgi:hypothetical protein